MASGLLGGSAGTLEGVGSVVSPVGATVTLPPAAGTDSVRHQVLVGTHWQHSPAPEQHPEEHGAVPPLRPQPRAHLARRRSSRNPPGPPPAPGPARGDPVSTGTAVPPLRPSPAQRAQRSPPRDPHLRAAPGAVWAVGRAPHLGAGQALADAAGPRAPALPERTGAAPVLARLARLRLAPAGGDVEGTRCCHHPPRARSPWPHLRALR